MLGRWREDPPVSPSDKKKYQTSTLPAAGGTCPSRHPPEFSPLPGGAREDGGDIAARPPPPSPTSYSLSPRPTQRGCEGGVTRGDAPAPP